MNSDVNQSRHPKRRLNAITVLIIVALSTIAGAVLGFANSLMEIWLDLANYGPENDNLIAAAKIESSYIRSITISVAIIGCVAGLLGSVIFSVWRIVRN